MQQQKLQCANCYLFYHKHALTEIEKVEGSQGVGSVLPALNTDAPTFLLPQITTIQQNVNYKGQNANKFPRLHGKHRQTGLCYHPDVDF